MWCRMATAPAWCSSRFSPINGTSTPRRWRSPRSRRCAKAKPCSCPQQWEATFFNWMENIQPWCISRQIWWGHQIPGLVWPGWQTSLRRGDRGEAVLMRWRLQPDRGDHGRAKASTSPSIRPALPASRTANMHRARRGRARHLVLLGAVAVLDVGLAGRDAGTQALLSDLRRSSPASTSSSSGSRG